MSITLLAEIEKTLRELDNLQLIIGAKEKELSPFKDIILKKNRRKGSTNDYYYIKDETDPKGKYLGTDLSNSMINQVKEARYVSELGSAVENDVNLLQLVKRKYIVPDYETINSRLPKAYRFPRLDLLSSGNGSAEEWKKSMEIKKAAYPPYKPENLTHRASDGTMMRSLSEVLIANYLISKGIVFVYELPYKYHGKTILPDFTILSPVDHKTVIIIEHQGAMDSEDYQRKYIHSLLFYLQTPLIPNKNLFFTFNHVNRNLDLRQIDSILYAAFGI